MAWQYRRRIRVAPGVYVNLGKNGVSTSIRGGKGMSVTMGKNGVYLNTSIPGTGLYNRQKMFSSNVEKSISTIKPNIVASNGGIIERMGWIVPSIIFFLTLFIMGMLHIEIGLFWAFGVAFVIAIVIGLIYGILRKDTSSQDIFSYTNEIAKVDTELKHSEGIKSEILHSYKECLSLAKEIDKEESILDALRLKAKGKDRYQEKIKERESILKRLIEKRECARYDAMSGVSSEQRQRYVELSESFLGIFKDSKVWFDNFNNVAEAGCGVFDYIKCNEDVPVIDIPSFGLKIFLYPLFLIYAKTNTEFSIIPIKEAIATFASSRLPLMEERNVPLEVKRIYSTYRYTTKNGNRDLRYSYNPVLVKVEVGFMKFGLIDKPFILSQVTEPEFCKKLLQYRSGNYHKVSVSPKADIIQEHKAHNEYSEYMKEVENAAEQIYSICKECQTDAQFIQVLTNNPGIDVSDGNGNKKSPEQAIPDLFLVDIVHCYSELVDNISIKEKEGVGISYLIAKLLNTKLKFEDTTYVIKNGNGIFESVVSQYSQMSYNGFIVADIFKQYSREKRLAYLVSLYRFASITAKADGQVSPKEQRMLSKILSMEDENLSPINNSQPQQIESNASQVDKSDDSPIDKLNSLIGLSSVKAEVNTLVNFIKIQNQRKQQGLHVPSISYHCVFTGNPGTGKTTVARILASIYKELGVCTKGHLVEIDRSGLVAEYVGQTAVKTNKVVDSALDGVLFVDEAYSLISGGQNDYGKEAVDTLLKRMEDDRSRLVVIMAGYKEEMKSLINSNPGLQSRFNRYIDFPDYTADELLSIFEGLINQYDYCLTEDAKMVATALFKNSVLTKNDKFGNGRYVRNVFEKTLENQANRLSSQCKLDSIMLKQIQGCDIPQV